MKEWMSIVEYARHHQVSDMTVRRGIKSGKIEAVLQEGKYYIPAAAQPLSPPVRNPGPVYTPSRPPLQVPRESLPFSLPSEENSGVTLQARELFSLCKDVVAKVSDREKLLENTLVSKEQAFAAQLACLREELKNRELQIGHLEQQIEDLKLLVQMLDKSQSF